MADPSHPSAQGTAADGKDQVLDTLHGEAPADSDSAAADARAAELMVLRRENKRLREAAGQAVVEQAKGALMLRYGIDAERAHEVLTGWSQECDIDVHTVAHTLVNVVCSGAEHAQSVEPTLVRWLEAHLRRGADAAGDVVAPPEHVER